MKYYSPKLGCIVLLPKKIYKVTKKGVIPLNSRKAIIDTIALSRGRQQLRDYP